MCLQEPCVKATQVFYGLVAQRHGIRLADAAAPLADATMVRQVLSGAGFSDVQARICPTGFGNLALLRELLIGD